MIVGGKLLSYDSRAPPQIQQHASSSSATLRASYTSFRKQPEASRLFLPTMKYVALLSGGKDSCYNLLHCSRNAHKLVAAASLRPEQGKGPLTSTFCTDHFSIPGVR